MKPSSVLPILIGLTLAACGSIGQTPAPLPTVILDNPSSSTQVRASASAGASGVLVPSAEAQLAFAQDADLQAGGPDEIAERRAGAAEQGAQIMRRDAVAGRHRGQRDF